MKLKRNEMILLLVVVVVIALGIGFGFIKEGMSNKDDFNSMSTDEIINWGKGFMEAKGTPMSSTDEKGLVQMNKSQLVNWATSISKASSTTPTLSGSVTPASTSTSGTLAPVPASTSGSNPFTSMSKDGIINWGKVMFAAKGNPLSLEQLAFLENMTQPELVNWATGVSASFGLIN
jgi:hypothetical protein